MDKVYIIAEAGVNHNGDFNKAISLIDRAKDAGVDAIKFQTFKSEKLVSEVCEMADYQKDNLKKDGSQLEMLKKLELSNESYIKLKAYCEKVEIEFLSTPFDTESLHFIVNELKVRKIKVASGDLNNFPFLDEVANKNLSTIISTGMADLGEVSETVKFFEDHKIFNKDLSILHCTTNYPTPYEEVNLFAMQTIGNAFKRDVGYSDHTIGIEVPICAVGLGAKIIEKHFTLDKTLEGPDHSASLDPLELKQMVMSIRNIEKALGNGIKEPNKSEIKIKDTIRKSLVLTKDIESGETITNEYLTQKRPGYGVQPRDLNIVLGMTVKQTLKRDTVLQWKHFK